MQTGWVEIAGGRYYFNSDGIMQTGWLTLSGTQYYLGESGSAYTGWQEVGGIRCYFDNSGARVIGWVTASTGRHYLYEDGMLATGFQEIDGVKRYFTPTGEYIILVNPWNTVPKDYELNLVDIRGFRVDASCRDALEQMMADCESAGMDCELNSAYRAISTQQGLWDNRYNSYIANGYSHEEAKRLTGQIVAIPGTSEHHLGLAVDIVGDDSMYAWMAEHSWEYGFILRDPDNKVDVTGIIYEPWHFRYVGKELAADIYQSGLCLEEYLDMLETA